MKITYLDNSGFAVFYEKLILIFDYYNFSSAGATANFAGGVVDEAALRAAEHVYFFVSHRHYDHFSRRIFDLAALNENTDYIVEAGIRRFPPEAKVHRLIKEDVFADGNIRATAHPSTDIGVSFQVEIGGKTIFHAGDLNCWHWAGECSADQETANRARYTQALAVISRSMGRPDIAFFPLDRRLKGPYDDGAIEFIADFAPRLFVPMHFQENFWVPREFKQKMAGRQEVYAISSRGESFEA